MRRRRGVFRNEPLWAGATDSQRMCPDVDGRDYTRRLCLASARLESGRAAVLLGRDGSIVTKV